MAACAAPAVTAGNAGAAAAPRQYASAHAASMLRTIKRQATLAARRCRFMISCHDNGIVAASPWAGRFAPHPRGRVSKTYVTQDLGAAGIIRLRAGQSTWRG